MQLFWDLCLLKRKKEYELCKSCKNVSIYIVVHNINIINILPYKHMFITRAQGHIESLLGLFFDNVIII